MDKKFELYNDKWYALMMELPKPKVIEIMRMKVTEDSKELLNRYTKFLQDKGYLDTDATLEEPNAIDEFIKYEASTNI